MSDLESSAYNYYLEGQGLELNGTRFDSFLLVLSDGRKFGFKHHSGKSYSHMATIDTEDIYDLLSNHDKQRIPEKKQNEINLLVDAAYRSPVNVPSQAIKSLVLKIRGFS